MLKLSKLTDYATVVMVLFSHHKDELFTAKRVADSTHLNLPTVSKLLKLLTAANLLTSHRGTKGGYTLSRDASAISVASIIEAIEGKPNLTECSDQDNHCSIQHSCQIQGNWQLISQAIQTALESVSLAEFAVTKQKVEDFRIPLNEIRRVMSDDANKENAR